jgi:hypothetical protein
VSDHIPDLTKMIGETPMTDMMEQHAPVGLRRNSAFEQSLDLSRQLERELNAANERIKRLEEVGDALFENSTPSRYDLPVAADRKLVDQSNWTKAKEAKP